MVFWESGILTKGIITQGKIHRARGIQHLQGVTSHSSGAVEALNESLAKVKDKLHLLLKVNPWRGVLIVNHYCYFRHRRSQPSLQHQNIPEVPRMWSADFISSFSSGRNLTPSTLSTSLGVPKPLPALCSPLKYFPSVPSCANYPQPHLKQSCGGDFEYWLGKGIQFADWSLVPSQNHPHIIYMIIIYMKM